MRITNVLDLTEQHRYCVLRDFSLSNLDFKLLNLVYQPMVGAYAVSLFYTLYGQIAADRTGYSAVDMMKRLFLMLSLEPNEQGRRFFIDQTSKLEAVGLMQTYRKYIAATDDYIFEYRLHPPLPATQFFQTEHLVQLLRNKLGKYSYDSVKRDLQWNIPEELQQSDIQAEDLTVPFYDMFQLNSQQMDPEWEQAAQQIAAGAVRPQPLVHLFQYEDIISRFPKGVASNRKYVEALKDRPDQLDFINHTARSYDLTLKQIALLLDEEGIFSQEGELRTEMLKQKATQYNRQDKGTQQLSQPLEKRNTYVDKKPTSSSTGNSRGRPSSKSQKPKLPFYNQTSERKPVTEEKMREILKLAEQMDER